MNLLIAKYALGLPFNRVIAMLSFQGLEVAPGTLAGVARRLDGLLAPLAAAIAARNAAAGHAHADETSWRVFGQPADCGGDRWWLWVFTGPDTVVYQIAPSRSLKVLEDHYGVAGGQLPAGRGPLVISSDFYSVYRSFSGIDGVTPLWCWSHIRRRFIRAGDANRKELGAWADAWTAGSARCTPRTGAGRRPGRHQRARPGRPPRSGRRWRTSTLTAASRAPARTCCTRPRPRCWPPWTANGTGWPPTATSPPCRWTITPPSGPSAPRSSAARTTTAPARHGPRSLAGHAWTILGTARIAGHNPRAYLAAYLDACAANGGKPPAGQALAALLPWTITLPGEPGSRKDHPP